MSIFGNLFGKAPAAEPKTVYAVQPTSPVVVVFIPNEDFFSPETQSQYCKGMKYFLREGNQRLAEQIQSWVADGKIQVL